MEVHILRRRMRTSEWHADWPFSANEAFHKCGMFPNKPNTTAQVCTPSAFSNSCVLHSTHFTARLRTHLPMLKTADTLWQGNKPEKAVNLAPRVAKVSLANPPCAPRLHRGRQEVTRSTKELEWFRVPRLHDRCWTYHTTLKTDERWMVVWWRNLRHSSTQHHNHKGSTNCVFPTSA